jgi:hypothetical protein
MPKIHVSVQNKIARAARCDGSIVCGNTDYEIVFSFDAEWDAFEEKTARFLYDNGYLDIPFRGASCPVPYMINATSVEVGVYAGELHTTTAAVIPCRPSVCSNDRAELRPEAVELYRDAALEAAREAKGHAEYADMAASAAKISAEVAFAMTHELREDSEKAAAYAERMEAHAAAYRKRYATRNGGPRRHRQHQAPSRRPRPDRARRSRPRLLSCNQESKEKKCPSSRPSYPTAPKHRVSRGQGRNVLFPAIRRSSPGPRT